MTKFDTAEKVTKLQLPLLNEELSQFKEAATSKRLREKKRHSKTGSLRRLGQLPLRDIIITLMSLPSKKRGTNDPASSPGLDDIVSPKKSPRTPQQRLANPTETISIMTPKALIHHGEGVLSPILPTDLEHHNNLISSDCINALGETIHLHNN